MTEPKITVEMCQRALDRLPQDASTDTPEQAELRLVIQLAGTMCASLPSLKEVVDHLCATVTGDESAEATEAPPPPPPPPPGA